MSSTGARSRPTSRRYSLQEKEQAVRMVRAPRAELGTSRGTVKQVANPLGYGVESVRSWCKQTEIDGGDAPGATTAEQARIKALEQENRELEHANAILRSSAIFFATELELADVIRRQFAEPKDAPLELFSRIMFNVLLDNTDDHPRNHAAFWDGTHATLTPAYDICPQPRSGGEAAQAMAIGREGQRLSRLDVCVDAAEIYLLEPSTARDIVERLAILVHEQWDDAGDQVGLTDMQRRLLWGRAVCNPYVFTGN